MADPIHGHYRTKEELESQKKKDPIEKLRDRLRDDGMLDNDALAAIEREVEAVVQDALDFADQSPNPEPAALYADVYAD
jgi:2-oxoisovalerate dehydrogenase E1 component